MLSHSHLCVHTICHTEAFLYFSSVLPYKFLCSNLEQVMTASFHIAPTQHL
jgi:hypothetical protein